MHPMKSLYDAIILGYFLNYRYKYLLCIIWLNICKIVLHRITINLFNKISYIDIKKIIDMIYGLINFSLTKDWGMCDYMFFSFFPLIRVRFPNNVHSQVTQIKQFYSQLVMHLVHFIGKCNSPQIYSQIYSSLKELIIMEENKYIQIWLCVSSQINMRQPHQKVTSTMYWN
jgi:hypothetical protein